MWAIRKLGIMIHILSSMQILLTSCHVVTASSFRICVVNILKSFTKLVGNGFLNPLEKYLTLNKWNSVVHLFPLRLAINIYL